MPGRDEKRERERVVGGCGSEDGEGREEGEVHDNNEDW
jgi:hypothetical protein